jgi:pyruvate dehydrogenase E2 component (dihydrolipoamide acetyltransferase)
MPIEVKMAKLSPTMESGQLVKWLVKVGDKVKEGDTLAEVQTDKAVMPMESFDDGVVARLDVKEGDEIALGQRVLVLAKKGEDPKSVADQIGGDGASAGSRPATKAPQTDAEQHLETPAADADDSGPESSDDATDSSRRIRSSPLARKIAADAGVDLSRVRGSGPGGRIVKEDVEAFLAGKPSAKAESRPSSKPAESQPSSTPVKAAPPAPPTTLKAERIPHTRMRKTIADRMVQAKQQAPEIHITIDIRMDRVLAAREALNARLKAEGLKLSVGDFITKAVALSLIRHPMVNASWTDEAIVKHGEVNIGIAVALDGGLIVPVLHGADRLGLREIRRGTLELAESARGNRLTTKQMMGGTFTVSNLGMYGVKQFDAILNLPEVAILAVGTTEARPVVENGQLAVGQVMTVTLTADHRVVDGAAGAEFLRTFQGYLEEPASMLL